jgi:DNA polymerase I
MNRLIIIDGNAILHRAFHALPPLTDPTGRVVNAVYGFTSMLIKLVTDLTPSHIAVCFDRPKPTFRKEMLATYQANRPEMDETLVPQIGILHELLTAFTIPVFEMDGYEADDVIGTIVKKSKDESPPARLAEASSKRAGEAGPKSKDGIDQIIIVTGDRDILQLVVDEKVLAYMPTKGLSEAKLYGEKEVVERMGVAPNKIADYKGLAGDASDNYPGVPGVGPKTAVSLLATYGSIEALYKAIDTNSTKGISENTIEKLKTGKDSAFLSKDLATIRTNAPVEFDVSKCSLPVLDTEASRAFLTNLSFPSLVKRLHGEVVKKEKSTEKKQKQSSAATQMDLFS